MPSHHYALKKGGMTHLEVRWEFFSQKRTILFDGKEIGIIPNEQAWKKGWHVTTKHGAILSIKKGNLWVASYDIRVDDVPLPNTAGDPQRRVNNAAGAILYVAIASVLIGIISIFSRNGYPGVPHELAGPTVLSGVIYVAMAFFVWRGSLIALVITMIGYAIDTLSVILNGPLGFLNLSLTGIIIRPVIFYLMALAISPLREWRAQKAAETKARLPRPPLTKMEMSLLLAAIAMVGVVVIGVVMSNASLRKAVYVAANLPLTPTWTPRPSETPRPTMTLTPSQTPIPVAQAAMREDVQSLPFSYLNVSGEYYSEALDIFVFTSSHDELHIVNPETDAYTSIQLIDDISAFALSPSGKFAVVGHRGEISYVDLVNARVSKILDVTLTEVLRLLFPDEAWIYASGDSAADIQILDIETGVETMINAENFPAHASLGMYSADYKTMYLTDSGTITRVDISDPKSPVMTKWESPSTSGGSTTTMTISWDKKYAYTDDSLVLKLSPQPANDLIRQGVFSSAGTPLDYGRVRLYSLGPNWVARLGDDGTMLVYQTGDWNSEEQFEPKVIFLSPLITGIPNFTPHTVRYRRIFVNAAGTRYYLTFHFQSHDTGVNYGLIARDVPPPP